MTIWFHQHEDRVRGWRGSIPAARRYADAAHMRFAAVPWPDGTATRWQNRRFPRSRVLRGRAAGREPFAE